MKSRKLTLLAFNLSCFSRLSLSSLNFSSLALFSDLAASSASDPDADSELEEDFARDRFFLLFFECLFFFLKNIGNEVFYCYTLIYPYPLLFFSFFRFFRLERSSSLELSEVDEDLERFFDFDLDLTSSLEISFLTSFSLTLLT